MSPNDEAPVEVTVAETNPVEPKKSKKINLVRPEIDEGDRPAALKDKDPEDARVRSRFTFPDGTTLVTY